MRQAIVAALRRDPELVPRLTGSLRARIDGNQGAMATVVAAAEAIEPILADAVRQRPSKLGVLGLKSAHMLASLAADDSASNSALAQIARGGIVGILFVDVADFTKFTARNGDEAASELIGKVHQLVTEKTKNASGQCLKHLGDGFLVAFPSASQAVRGAVALRDGVRRRRVADPTFGAKLRLAVHAGEPLVDGDDLLGHDVNLTARLLDHCRPDEVVVSEAAKELAEKRLRSIRFSKARRVKIRGLSGRHTIYSASSALE